LYFLFIPSFSQRGLLTVLSVVEITANHRSMMTSRAKRLPNPRAAQDAAVAFSLFFGGQWRRASEPERYGIRGNTRSWGSVYSSVAHRAGKSSKLAGLKSFTYCE
jgi:hypothetical protein